MDSVNLGGFEISGNSPCFIIAELSANHNGDYEIAEKTIRAMKDAGADAVKVQTFSPDTLTIDHHSDLFMIKGNALWEGKNLYELYKEAMMPWEWQPKLKALAESLGMIFFSTPTDSTSVDFLEELDVPFYKLASFEITDIPLIEYIAQKQKPIIFSTGISTHTEIEDAIGACEKYGNKDYIFLKCTSAYPTPWEEVNLNVIPGLKEKYNCPIGLSDHTMGYIVPLGAVALGAKVVEKHFILDRKLGGPDATFSMEPQEFKQMVDNIRILEKTLGNSELSLSQNARKSLSFSRSLFVVTDIQKGEEFSSVNVRPIRPGYGLRPKHLNNILGKKASVAIKKGTPLDWDLIEN